MAEMFKIYFLPEACIFSKVLKTVLGNNPHSSLYVVRSADNKFFGPNIVWVFPVPDYPYANSNTFLGLVGFVNSSNN